MTKQIITPPILWGLFFLTRTLLADPPPPGVTISLELSSTNIWPHEMIYASTVVSNVTDDPIVQTVVSFGRACIRDERGQWKASHPYHAIQCMPVKPFDIVLPPHEAFNVYDTISTDYNGKSFLSSPGVREIKFFTCFGESDIVHVNVRPVPGGTETPTALPDTTATLFDKYSFQQLCLEEHIALRTSFAPWALPFMRELEQHDEYADWLHLVRIWDALNDRGKEASSPDQVAALCRTLIDKYADRVVPEDRNPIPLAMAYEELARCQGTTGHADEAYKTLSEAREKFAGNTTLLLVLAWEGLGIPQTPKPPPFLIWWNSRPPPKKTAPPPTTKIQTQDDDWDLSFLEQ